MGEILFIRFEFSEKASKYLISDKLDVEILMQIIKDVGGLPLLQGSTWDESKSSMSDLVMRIRQTLGQGINETFDIASFIINLESANNVSLP